MYLSTRMTTVGFAVSELYYLLQKVKHQQIYRYSQSCMTARAVDGRIAGIAVE